MKDPSTLSRNRINKSKIEFNIVELGNLLFDYTIKLNLNLKINNI